MLSYLTVYNSFKSEQMFGFSKKVGIGWLASLGIYDIMRGQAAIGQAIGSLRSSDITCVAIYSFRSCDMSPVATL